MYLIQTGGTNKISMLLTGTLALQLLSLNYILCSAHSVLVEQLAPVQLEESPGAEDNLERWIQQEAKRESCKQLEGQLDEVTASFASALLNEDTTDSQQLKLELAHALNLAELMPEAIEGNRAAARGIQRSKGVLDVLESEQPLVVHSTRLSPEAIEQLRQFARERPQPAERQVLERFFETAAFESTRGSQLVAEEDTAALLDGQGGPSSWSDLDELANSALFLSETLVLTPDFVMNLPVLGAGVRQLRGLGQATFVIIKTINSFKRFMDNLNQDIQSKERSLLAKLHSFAKRDADVRLYSKKGVTHLLKLAHNMADQFIKVPGLKSSLVREIAVRCAYYLLINFSTQVPLCN